MLHVLFIGMCSLCGSWESSVSIVTSESMNLTTHPQRLRLKELYTLLYSFVAQTGTTSLFNFCGLLNDALNNLRLCNTKSQQQRKERRNWKGSGQMQSL